MIGKNPGKYAKETDEQIKLSPAQEKLLNAYHPKASVHIDETKRIDLPEVKGSTLKRQFNMPDDHSSE